MTYQFQSILREEFNEFLQYRINCGYSMAKPIYVLKMFDRHLVSKDYQCKELNSQIVMSFLQLRENERLSNLRNRSSTIQGFLKYLKHVKGYNTFTSIPTHHLNDNDEFIPYIYSDEEIAKILACAKDYPHHPNATLPNIENIISCIFPMLYCTGMRAGEAIGLHVEDVDLNQQLIFIREAKNHNKRLLPISDSLTEICRKYVENCSDKQLSDIYFFDTGSELYSGKLSIHHLYFYFRKILSMAGIQHRGRGNGPRMHDLRHTFTCHSLRQLSKLDGDINAYLVYLSTYLGHKSLRETQQYVWLTAELFEETRQKLEAYTNFINEIYEEAITDEGTV